MRGPLIVFTGGGLGSCLRAVLFDWLSGWGGSLPAPVLLVNLLGSFALGIVFVLADEAKLLGVNARLFLAVGVLGGFTTFSTFGWGADLLLSERGGMFVAVAYLLASVLGGALAVWLGLLVGRIAGRALAPDGPATSVHLSGRGGRPLDGVAAAMGSEEAEDR